MTLAPLWIFLIGSIMAGGAIDDALARKPAWHVASGVVAGIVCALFVAVSFGLLRYHGSGVMLLALAFTAGAWLVYETAFDIRLHLHRETRQSRAAVVATIVLGLLYLPALLLGAKIGWELVAGSASYG